MDRVWLTAVDREHLMDRFEEYTHAVLAASPASATWKFELLDPVGRLLATDDVTEATGQAAYWQVEADPVEVQSDLASARTSTITFTSSIDLVPRDRTGGLHPESAPRVRAWAGITTSSGTTLHPQFTALIDELRADDMGGVPVFEADLVDAIHPVRSDLSTTFRFVEGETVEAVVTRLIGQVIPTDELAIQATGFTTGGADVEVGTSRYDLVNSLLEGCGHELIADPYGVVTSQEILPSSEDDSAKRWVYGEQGIPIESPARTWRSFVPRGWVVEGASTTDGEPEVAVTVFDLDRSSLGFFQGIDVPAIMETARYPYARTRAQLQVAGYGLLRRHGSGPGLITFRTLPNPAIRRGDLVELTMTALKLDRASARVLDYRLPLHNEGLMTITARLVWEPDLGFITPGIELDLDCEVSFSDDFDRPDEDLQLLPGSDDGSAVWTEMGFSWGVEGGWAVQRFGGPDPWSLAIVNEALCTSDQHSEVTIRRLPSGRRVGPLVRSDGAFNGYTALASNQNISLELWINGSSAAVLGSHSLMASPVGSTVRVSAVGSTISVLFDGETVISVSDDRQFGAFVGMLGYGGYGDQAPAVQPFAAAAAS